MTTAIDKRARVDAWLAEQERQCEDHWAGCMSCTASSTVTPMLATLRALLPSVGQCEQADEYRGNYPSRFDGGILCAAIGTLDGLYALAKEPA